MQSWPPNAVYLTAWLVEQGYSTQLLNRYKKSKWIHTLGNGAVLKTGDTPTIEGAMYALQKQAKLSVHPAGKTALEILGKAHYLAFNQRHYVLFSQANESLPSWMINRNWDMEIHHVSTSFLPTHLGLVEHVINGLNINISNPARALMECLYQVPKKQDLLECYQIMQGLNNLRPIVVQQLLEACTSIKVKRLFLFLATKSEHQWLSHVKLSNIDLGKGKRQIVENGVFIPAFKITVPKSLANDSV